MKPNARYNESPFVSTIYSCISTSLIFYGESITRVNVCQSNKMYYAPAKCVARKNANLMDTQRTCIHDILWDLAQNLVYGLANRLVKLNDITPNNERVMCHSGWYKFCKLLFTLEFLRLFRKEFFLRKSIFTFFNVTRHL